jgi:hypothetical protein
MEQQFVDIESTGEAQDTHQAGNGNEDDGNHMDTKILHFPQMTAFSIELHHPMLISGRVAEIRPAPVTGVVKPLRAGRAVDTTWTSFG